MDLPFIVIKLNGLHDTLQDESFADLYIGNSSHVEDKIKTAFHLGYTAFYLEEDKPSFDLIVKVLSRYPRESYFLMTSTHHPEKNLKISSTLGYYDLLLFRPDSLVHLTTFEDLEEKLEHIWRRMATFLEKGLTRSLGVENFYSNYYLSLLKVISHEGLPHVDVNLLAFQVEQDLLDLITSFGTDVIVKVPPELTTIDILARYFDQGVSSFLSEAFPSNKEVSPESRDPLGGRDPLAFDLIAQASSFADKRIGILK